MGTNILVVTGDQENHPEPQEEEYRFVHDIKFKVLLKKSPTNTP